MNSVRVVVDVNVIWATLYAPHGWKARQFWRSDLRLFAPDWLLEEFEAHCVSFSRRLDISADDLRERLAGLLERIEIVSAARWKLAAQHPRVSATASVDEKDGPYMATQVIVDASYLWTRDKALQEAFPGLAVPAVPNDP